jgi:DNA-binding XRE family transcriptional regulator
MNSSEVDLIELLPNPETKQAIANRLEIARLAVGYSTQQAFAATIGVSPQKWNNYASARDRISLDIALDLCRKHRLTLDWIYRGDPSGLPVALARRIEEMSAKIDGLAR